MGRAKNQLGQNDLEAAGFWIQQSLELAIKGCIISHPEGELIKEHGLGYLLKKLLQFYPEFAPSLEPYRDFVRKFEPFYIEARYPMEEMQMPDSKQFRQYLDTAEQLLKILTSIAFKQENP